MSSSKKNIFITPQDIYRTWKQWEQSSPNLEDRTIPEELAKQAYLLCTKLTSHRNFCGYSYHLKDEMIQEGVIKICKNLKNMKEDRNTQFFSYWTRVAWTAFITVLSKHYRDLNRNKQRLQDALLEAQTLSPTQSNSNLIKVLQEELDRYSEQYGGEGDGVQGEDIE